MIKSIILAPFAVVYGALTEIRKRFYERGIFKSSSLPVPVISVGNITVGGTGKTPLVARIAEILSDSGEKVCILTRGYKRENERARILVSDGEKILVDVKKAGDEPLELAEKLLGKAIVIADANRFAAGEWVREKFGVSAFVLDDAFQHLKVKRDLDIVCIDATNPFGNEKVLPAGILREPLENLCRANLIVITRANLVENISELKKQISKFTSAKIYVSKNKFAADFCALNSAPIAAFCALGNPQNFFAQLAQEKFKLVVMKTFPDHHFYTQNDIDELENQARENGAKYLVTTAKDAVKLSNFKFRTPLKIAKSEIVFEDEIAFREIILKQITAGKN